jgi:hypothetical protein
MVNAMGFMPLTKIRCRQIGGTDVGGVVDLLARGFPNHGREFWARVLARLTEHPTPAGLPKYGYLLESDGAPVGVILLIFSTIRSGTGWTTRGNVSSWYVDPTFRGYAPFLVTQAVKHKNVTYLNVTPTQNTWPILDAQGYSRTATGYLSWFQPCNCFRAMLRSSWSKRTRAWRRRSSLSSRICSYSTQATGASASGP